MRAERDGLVVEYDHLGTVVVGETQMDPDAARWLQAVALPAALAAVGAEVPSDPPASVHGENGQIPGQLAIE